MKQLTLPSLPPALSAAASRAAGRQARDAERCACWTGHKAAQFCQCDCHIDNFDGYRRMFDRRAERLMREDWP